MTWIRLFSNAIAIQRSRMRAENHRAVGPIEYKSVFPHILITIDTQKNITFGLWTSRCTAEPLLNY